MARKRRPVETVALTSPHGGNVRVPKAKAEHYKARGYKAVVNRAPAKKPADES